MAEEYILNKYKIVMLIDDDSIDNFINEKIIKKSNFTKNVFVHTNASSALEFLKNLEAIKNDSIESILPSYIFLDLNMPVSDGFYFLEEFKKISERITSEIKIVMLSSSLNPNDEKKSATYKNVVKFLPKPLSVEALMNMN